jgi:transcriptional regulator with PAS, ATPase and Fis domain
MVKHDTIQISDIPAPYNHSEKEKSSETQKMLFTPTRLKDAQKAFEVEFIRQKLSQHDNDISKTAKAINVSLSYLKKRVADLSI